MTAEQARQDALGKVSAWRNRLVDELNYCTEHRDDLLLHNLRGALDYATHAYRAAEYTSLHVCQANCDASMASYSKFAEQVRAANEARAKQAAPAKAM